MKKKLLRIMMIPALGLILSVCGSLTNLQAQILQEWTIGTNSGSIDYYSVPGYYYYANSMLELVYAPDTLPKEQAIIHSISFYVYGQYNVTSSDPTVNPVKIFMANASPTYQANAGTNCDNIENLGTLVYDGDMGTPVVSEYMTFELNEPFVYEPGNKLVIFFKTERTGPATYGTGYFNIQTYYNSIPNCGYSGYYGGQPGQCPPAYSMTTNNSAATHIKFSYETIKMKYLQTELSTPTLTSLSDRRYAVLRANVTTEKWADPISVSRFTVNNLGTSTTAAISNMQLYFTSSSENFSDGSGILLSTINNPVSGNNTFNINNPPSLATGDNYFWVVYEVDVTRTHCNATLRASSPSLVITDKGVNSTKTPITIDNRDVPINYSHISINNIKTDYVLCSTVVDTSISIPALGTVRSYKWDRWNYETNEWNTYTEESLSNNTIISKEDVLNGYDLYRVTLYPPLGDCAFDPAQTELTFSVTNDITSATARVADQVAPNDENIYTLNHGEVLNFRAEVAGDVKAYVWQYTQDGEYWFDFSLLEQPTANTPNFSFIADESLGNIQIRMRAISEDACGTSMYTTATNVRIYKIPTFVLQPPKVVSLCPGENFYVSLNFYGEEPISQRWYKDGYPLTNKIDGTAYNSQELEFNGVTPETAGKYYYEILVPAVINNQLVNILIVSDTVSLYVLPETEVVTITKGNVKASEGGVAVLQVEASYAITNLDEPNGKFQWYRYNAITQQSTALINSHRIKGATSSVLSISYINSNDYTYNGDYYYCVVKGRCGGSQVATSEHIMLIPEQEVKIIKNPVDVVACQDKQVDLEVQAFAENTSALVYQWFYDNTELSDDTIFSGTNTKTLSINTIYKTTDFTNGFYCKVWLNGSSFVAQSEVAIVTVLEDYTPVIIGIDPLADTTIIGTVGKKLELSVETTRPATDMITWLKFNPATNKYESINNNGNVLNISELALADAGSYTILINTGCGTFIMDNEVVWTVEVVEPEIDDANSEASIVDSITLFNLNVLPNPATDKLIISYNSSVQDLSTIQIFDLRGTVIASFDSNTKIGTNHYNVDLEKYDLSTGGYFVKLSIGKNNLIKSFIITK